MIKIIQAMRRSPSLSRGKFDELYRNEQAELILEYYPQMKGFTWDLALDKEMDPNHMGPNFRRAPYDGLASFYFETLEDYMEADGAGTSSELRRDFLDNQGRLLKECHTYVVEEVVHWDNLSGRHKGKTSPGFKIIPFSHRSPRVGQREFFDHYREVHSSLAREHHPGISRYVQNFVIDRIGEGVPEADTTAELHFACFEDYRDKFYAHTESPKIIGRDVAAYADLGKMRFLLAEESVIK